MSGIVDSGRAGGLGNIDANDPLLLTAAFAIDGRSSPGRRTTTHADGGRASHALLSRVIATSS